MLVASSVPPISEELFNKLITAFPLVRPEPNVTTMDEIMCGAGEQRVIEWIRAHALQKPMITGADVSKSVRIR